MQDKNLFEYAVIRIVPRVEREEFLNAGVIVYCKRPAYLKTILSLDDNRLLSVFPGIDLEEVKKHLQAFLQISEGNPGAGPIAGLDTASRFRWLTAKRSTIVQTSPVHPGICQDLQSTLEKLLLQYVL